MPVLGIVASQVTGHLTPTSPVAGYEAWFDAANAGSFTFSSGTLVSSWVDRSGNAYQLNQSNASYQPTRNQTVNGNSAVLFGSSGYTLLKSNLAASSWTWLSNGTTSTVFMVFKPTDTTTFGQFLGTGESAYGTIMYDASLNGATDYISGGVYKGASGNPAAVWGTGSAHNSTLQLWTAYMDPNNASSSLRAYAFKNGSTTATGVDSSGTDSASASTPEYTLTMGASQYVGRYGMKNTVCEILIYKNTLLSQSDRLANYNYLKAKWGLP